MTLGNMIDGFKKQKVVLPERKAIQELRLAWTCGSKYCNHRSEATANNCIKRQMLAEAKQNKCDYTGIQQRIVYFLSRAGWKDRAIMAEMGLSVSMVKREKYRGSLNWKWDLFDIKRNLELCSDN